MAAKALPKKLRAENAKQLKGGVGTSAGRYIRFD